MKKEQIKQFLYSFTLFVFAFLLYNGRNIIQWNFDALFDFDLLIILLLSLCFYLSCVLAKDKSKKLKWLFSISVLIIALVHFVVPSVPIVGYVGIFYLLMFLAFIMKLITNRPLTLSLGIGTCLLLCVLYVLGLCNLLLFVPLILMVIVLGGCIYLWFYYHKKTHNIWNDLEEFINLEFVFFALLFVMGMSAGFERYVHSWDEYNMWALNAKKIIYQDSLDGFAYPPMMALWYYLCHLFTGFSEPNLYMAHNIFLYIFIMSIFIAIKDKKLYFCVFFLMLSFPHLFGGVFGYNNLYADFPSSVVFGFGMIYLYDSIKRKHSNQFKDRLWLYVMAIVITLIKPQGFVLATTLLVVDASVHAIEDYSWKKGCIKNNIWKIFKKYFLPLLLPLLLYLVWTRCSSLLFKVETFSSPDVAPNTMIGSFISEINLYLLLQFLLHVFKFLDQALFVLVTEFSTFDFLMVSFILLVLYYWIQTKKIGQAFIKIIPFALGTLCFYGLTTLSMIVMMNTTDALDLVSFGRYINNFNVGFIMFLIWFLVVDLYHTKKLKWSYIVVPTVIIFISVPMTSSFSFFADMGGRFSLRDEAQKRMDKFSVVTDNVEEDERVYIIDQQDKDGYLPMCYSLYYLYPRYTNVNGSINWKIQTESNREEIESWALSAEDLRRLLKENHFDYLFLYSSTEEFFDEIEYMVDGDTKNVEKYTLFEIVERDHEVYLKPVE